MVARRSLKSEDLVRIQTGSQLFIMEMNYSGLKCDHCSYRDDDVKWEDYEKSIGRPCPECGHSLLTQEDYDKCVKIVKMVMALNNFLRWFNPFYYFRRFIIRDMEWMTGDFYWKFKNKKQ